MHYKLIYAILNIRKVPTRYQAEKYSCQTDKLPCYTDGIGGEYIQCEFEADVYEFLDQKDELVAAAAATTTAVIIRAYLQFIPQIRSVHGHVDRGRS